MRRSEFGRAVDDEFGDAYGAVLRADLQLADIGGRTADQALRDGVPPRDVWLALCSAADVPENRRYGVGRLEPESR
ncbi:DUF3046 domain-containing protein [Microbacterium sp. NPDC078428]|uniref:DUF3046 domain-containing protein n=1 Tax=Microbacterium limosum TaxID=3079935 RepID=A0AAU0ME98_9MICO|nr:DUF3046 domain-containing protein [Microbacterium sp. Y20]WOQ68626.1 DUF3046 domain-containing protein [Microbacterium sp. Y20]